MRTALIPFLVFALLNSSQVTAADSARLVNISTRAAVGGIAGNPVPGFVLSGTGSKPIIVRAVGPALSGFGVEGALSDPQLTLINGSTTLAANDNWNGLDSVAMSEVGAFALPVGSRDAALVTLLGSGPFTAPVTATDGGVGVALVEVYDQAPAASPTIVNASTRAFVGTGDKVLIPAFVVGGSGSLRLLIRAIGPTLGDFGVVDTLTDPIITLHRGSTEIAANDNWGSAANATEIASSSAVVGAFALPSSSRDSALLVTLTPDLYSVVVRGVGDTTGTALVELYILPPTTVTPTEFTLTDIVASPAAPNYLDKVFITAKIPPHSGEPTPTLQLSHTIGANATTSTQAMFDDGLHGDGTAGDRVFGAAIPTQPAGTAVSYSVTASNSRDPVISSPSSSYVVASTLWNFAITDPTPELGFTSPEFLGIPTDRSVTLNLEANKTVELYVEYGPASGAYEARTPTKTYPVGEPIEVTIQSSDTSTRLHENHRYFYRVRYHAPGETVFRARGERSFQTARPKGTSFTFTITADPHLDEATDQDLFTIAMKNIGADASDFHVDLGDIFMSDKMAKILPGLPINFGLIDYRAVTLRNNFAEFAHSSPFMFILGNHEAEYRYVYDRDTSAAKDQNIASWNLMARKTHFPTPVPSEFYAGSTETRMIAGKDELLENYYAWEWGDALFIVLDPFNNTLINPNSDPSDNWRWSLGRPQYDWLKATLEKSSASYKFVFLHHLIGGIESARGGVEVAHRYEWGGKNADETEGFAQNRPGWAMPIHQLLLAHHVSAVFHGHDHFYGYQQLDGIVYQECPQPGTANFSTASAGDGQYVQGTILPNSGHLRVTVSPANTKVEYVRAVPPSKETPTLKNRTISHTYTMAPAN